VLNAYLFENLDQVREATAKWVHDYNHFRPHESLQNLSPIAYKEMNRK
jgi:putative transposase